MRTPLFAAALAILAMQGCASTGASSRPDNLASLPLFGPGLQPDFVVYLACEGKSRDQTVQCETVRHAVYDWSSDRHIRVHQVEMDDPAFRSDGSTIADNGSQLQARYRVAIQFRPDVIPSFDEWHGNQGNMSSGHVAGRAGYEATIFVFASTTGAQIEKLSLHEHKELPDHANVTPIIRAADGLPATGGVRGRGWYAGGTCD